jgi:hypothetical protein
LQTEYLGNQWEFQKYPKNNHPETYDNNFGIQKTNKFSLPPPLTGILISQQQESKAPSNTAKFSPVKVFHENISIGCESVLLLLKPGYTTLTCSFSLHWPLTSHRKNFISILHPNPPAKLRKITPYFHYPWGPVFFSARGF